MPKIKHNVQMQILDLFEKDSNFWAKSQIYNVYHSGKLEYCIQA